VSAVGIPRLQAGEDVKYSSMASRTMSATLRFSSPDLLFGFRAGNGGDPWFPYTFYAVEKVRARPRPVAFSRVNR
jgi:hypothetical protein